MKQSSQCVLAAALVLGVVAIPISAKFSAAKELNQTILNLEKETRALKKLVAGSGRGITQEQKGRTGVKQSIEVFLQASRGHLR